MKTGLIAVALSLGALAAPHGALQKDRQEMHICLADLIQRRIQAREPVQLTAETITLTGDTLKLTGRASVRFNETTIRADDVVFHQATKRIEFAGRVNAFLGSSRACADIPQIQSR